MTKLLVLLGVGTCVPSRELLKHAFIRCKQCIKTYCCNIDQQQVFKNPLRVLYFGSDSFAIPSLKMLHSKRQAGELAELAVVCVRLRAGQTATRAYAERHGLAVLDWPPQLAAGRYQLGVVASFGHLLPRRLIDLFPAGIINVHASLLPRWRGAAPVVHALLAGDRHTGVTIMKVKPHRFDVGDIVAQSAVEVSQTADVHQLTAELAEVGAGLLCHCLDDLPAALAAARPQTEHGVTTAPRQTAADYSVCWRRPAAALLRQSRALPGPLTTVWRGRRLRLPQLDDTGGADADVIDAARPGTLQRRGCQLVVRCGDGWLQLPRLQLHGKPAMSGLQFYNGFLSGLDADQRCLDS